MELLQQLIATPSFSGQEAQTAQIIEHYLQMKGVTAKRFLNNVWATSYHYDTQLPTVLLNSHHDTVQASSAYTLPPFSPILKDGKLYGLGSNDAGGSVYCLIETFIDLYREKLPFNLVLAITAEEEAICKNGISALWPELGRIDYAIVGEPTQMHVAIAERGLMVLDIVVEGVSGHAARNEGVNAIEKAMDTINWFRTFQFDKTSELMGQVKMTVTQINAGTQHNVIPAICTLVVDVRPTDCYTNAELFEIIQQHIPHQVKARSLHLNASAISTQHPLVKTAKDLGITCYISPTTSDISRMSVPAIKMGPGDSARSHTADEFIYIHELEAGLLIYKQFLTQLAKQLEYDT